MSDTFLPKISGPALSDISLRLGFCDSVEEDQIERSSVMAKYAEMAKDVR